MDTGEEEKEDNTIEGKGRAGKRGVENRIEYKMREKGRREEMRINGDDGREE